MLSLDNSLTWRGRPLNSVWRELGVCSLSETVSGVRMAPPGGRDWVRMTPRPFWGEQGSPQRMSGAWILEITLLQMGKQAQRWAW